MGEVLNELVQRADVQLFTLGLFSSFAVLLVVGLVVSDIPWAIIITAPIVWSVAFCQVAGDCTHVIAYLDWIVGAIWAFLLMRFVMSGSRSVIVSTCYGENKDKKFIIVLTFFAVVTSGYVLYNYNTSVVWNYKQDRTGTLWALLALLCLILTLVFDNGIISDFSVCFLCSVCYLCETDESPEHRDILTFMRLVFTIAPMISTLFKMPFSGEESRVFVVEIRKKRQRILTSLMLLSYVLTSPESVFLPGNVSSPIHAFFILSMYMLLLISEHLQFEKDGCRGYLCTYS